MLLIQWKPWKSRPQRHPKKNPWWARSSRLLLQLDPLKSRLTQLLITTRMRTTVQVASHQFPSKHRWQSQSRSNSSLTTQGLLYMAIISPKTTSSQPNSRHFQQSAIMNQAWPMSKQVSLASRETLDGIESRQQSNISWLSQIYWQQTWSTKPLDTTDRWCSPGCKPHPTTTKLRTL